MHSSHRIIKGSQPVVRTTFKDEDGEIANPAAVAVTTRSPSGTEIDYTSPNANITNPSTGKWYFTFPGPLTEVGLWWVYVRGTAGVIAATEVSFEVRGVHVT